jgi:Recombination endonuclease VII
VKGLIVNLKEKKAEWYQANKESEIERSKAYREANKEALKVARKERQQRDPEKLRAQQRKNDLKKKYNISPEDYDKMFEDQQGHCAICLTTSAKALHVDHNHETGKIRALLCSHCNVGLGHFKESLNLLDRAKEYLCKHNQTL